jgi:hypothetical protein
MNLIWIAKGKWAYWNDKSIFLPLNGQNGSRITPWMPYSQSSNPVVARSIRARAPDF